MQYCSDVFFSVNLTNEWILCNEQLGNNFFWDYWGEGWWWRMKRAKLGRLGHYDPIFRYPDIILKKNNYCLSKLKCFTLDLHCNINNHTTLSCSCLELYLFFVLAGSWTKQFLNKSRSIYKSFRCYIYGWKIGFKISNLDFVKFLKECGIWLF